MSERLGRSDDKAIATDLFTTVPVDLFRMGNASGPRLDNIREQDVPITTIRVGNEDIEMVSPKEGGISTFDACSAQNGKWWKIPSSVILPNTIHIVKDGYNRKMRANHYSLRPAYLMTKLTFAEGLRNLANHAIPMFRRQINKNADPTDKATGGVG